MSTTLDGSMHAARAIQTGTGPIDAADLGLTLIHEHVFVDMYEASLNSAGVLLDEPMAADELARFRAVGGVTIVDQTTLGLHPTCPRCAGRPWPAACASSRGPASIGGASAHPSWVSSARQS